MRAIWGFSRPLITGLFPWVQFQTKERAIMAKNRAGEKRMTKGTHKKRNRSKIRGSAAKIPHAHETTLLQSSLLAEFPSWATGLFYQKLATFIYCSASLTVYCQLERKLQFAFWNIIVWEEFSVLSESHIPQEGYRVSFSPHFFLDLLGAWGYLLSRSWTTEESCSTLREWILEWGCSSTNMAGWCFLRTGIWKETKQWRWKFFFRGRRVTVFVRFLYHAGENTLTQTCQHQG